MNPRIKKVEDTLTSEFNSTRYTDLIREIFPSVKIVAPDKFNKEWTNFASHIEGSYHVGNYVDPNGKKLIIHSVQLVKQSYVENSRSTQRSYAKKLMESGNADAAIVAFFTPGDPKWRLSFVRLDYEIKFENGKMSTTENMTPAKRYSYLVGKDEPCHTAISRFHQFITDDPNAAQPSLDDLEEAFSVEKVTQEFFNLYCEKFHQLREALEANLDFVEEARDHNFTSSQFAKKLMGQIVFLYFLQKKGWLGVGMWTGRLTKKQYDKVFYSYSGARKRLVQEYLPMVYVQAGEDEFRLKSAAFDQIPNDAEELIANALPDQRGWGSGSKTFMRTLFTYATRRGGNFFDDYLEPLFYNALNVNRGETGYDPDLHCRIPFLSGGLFEPIDGYDWKHNDFNIPNEIFSNRKDENDREADGILDIFDRYNFTMSEDEPLEREVAIDPEMLGKVFENLLEVNDRKSKGAFYTPREIVHYMCQETLISYLIKETGLKEQDVRDFILLGDFLKVEDTTKDRRQGDNEMLISEEMYKIDKDGNVVVDRLKDIDEALKNIRVADPAVGSGAFPLGMLNEIVRARQNISAYMAITMNGYEKRMMYNNERSPYTLKRETIKNCIFAADIEPSAVDIAQLRLWLSLVIDDDINPNAQSPLDGHRNPLALPNLECNIVCGNSLIDEFEGFQLINYNDALGNTSGAQMNVFQRAFDAVLPSLLEAQDALFSCDDPAMKQQWKETINALKNELAKAQMEGCSPEQWDHYQKAMRMASRPFVLWQIDFARVFREKGGFDVVIGNPPYVSAPSQLADPALAANRKLIVKSKRFETLHSKWDLYIPFMELGIQLLHDNGHFAMIVPYPLTNQIYGKKIREYFTEKYDMYKIADLNDVKIFEATVQNCIPFVRKATTRNETEVTGIIDGSFVSKFSLTYDQLMQDPKTKVWNLVQRQSITHKFEHLHVLGDYCYISYGLRPNSDEKVAKGEFKKADLISNVRDDVPRREYIEAKDTDKYEINRVRFLEYGTERSPGKLTRPTFPELYEHPKLLFNVLGELKGTFDVQGIYVHNHSLIACVLWKDLVGVDNNSISGSIKKFSSISRNEMEKLSQTVDLRFLLGVMNSEYAAELLRDQRSGDYHIYPEHIRNIPIPSATKEEQQEIIELVDQALKEKTDDVIAQIDEKVKALYEKSIGG